MPEKKRHFIAFQTSQENQIIVEELAEFTQSETSQILTKISYLFESEVFSSYERGVGQVCKSIKNSQILFCTTVRCRGKDAFLMPSYCL
jgi:hypothetical protein